MNPLCRFGLTHAEQAAMEQVDGILLEVDQNEQQTIFWCWQGTVRIGRVASQLPAPSMQSPCRPCSPRTPPQRAAPGLANSSTVKLVKSNTSVVWIGIVRYRNIICASCRRKHSITQIVMNSTVLR